MKDEMFHETLTTLLLGVLNDNFKTRIIYPEVNRGVQLCIANPRARGDLTIQIKKYGNYRNHGEIDHIRLTYDGSIYSIAYTEEFSDILELYKKALQKAKENFNDELRALTEYTPAV